MRFGFVFGWLAIAAFVGTFMLSLFGWLHGLTSGKGSVARLCGRTLAGLVALGLAWLIGMVSGLVDRLNDAVAVAALLAISLLCITWTMRVLDVWSKEARASRAKS